MALRGFVAVSLGGIGRFLEYGDFYGCAELW